MRIHVSKILRVLAAVAVTFAFVACNKKLPTEEARAWFDQHKSDLLKLHKVLLEERSINRIDPALGVRFVPKYTDFSRHTLEVYEMLESQCKSLGIQNACVSRVGNTEAGTIISVQYTLSSVGIAPSSGGFLSVEYTTDSDYLKQLREKGLIVESLVDEGWYVIKSDI